MPEPDNTTALLDIFREALRPKIRIVDPAALREGHWT